MKGYVGAQDPPWRCREGEDGVRVRNGARGDFVAPKEVVQTGEAKKTERDDDPLQRYLRTPLRPTRK